MQHHQVIGVFMLMSQVSGTDWLVHHKGKRLDALLAETYG